MKAGQKDTRQAVISMVVSANKRVVVGVVMLDATFRFTSEPTQPSSQTQSSDSDLQLLLSLNQ